MKKTLLLLCTFLCSLGMWAEEVTVATFKSSDAVTNSSYTINYGGDDWNISMGGNNKSIGFNNKNCITIGDALGTEATASNYGVVVKSKNKLENVNKITFTYSGGSGQGGKIYLAYSTDGSNWSAIGLKSGTGLSTQGSTVASTLKSPMVFTFEEIASAYYAFILDSGDKQTAAYRFDNVETTFIQVKGDTPTEPVDPTITATNKTVGVEDVVDIAEMFSSNSTGTMTYAITGAPVGAVENNDYLLDDSEFYATMPGEYTVTATQAAVEGIYNEGSQTATITVSQKYTVTFGTPSNGSFIIKQDENILSSGAKVLVGSVLNLEATPNAGYEISSWNITNASTSEEITVTDNKFTMPAANVNVSATFVEKTKYTISWSVNGTVTNTQDFYEGADIEFPTNVANPVSGNSKAFAGWLESTSIGDEPVFVTSAKATATKTYYAVFANKIAGSERLVKITNITNVTPGTYALICYDEKTYVSNAAATSSCPLQATVQKEQDEIIITDDMMWTVTKNDVGGYNIESVVEKGKFLWGGSANDGTRVTATSGKANAKKTWFAIADNTYGVVLYNEASDPQKRYLATYGTNDWRNYTSMSSTQKPANLYKLESAIIYKNHTTTIESAPSSTNLNAKGYASFSSDYELSIAEGAKAYTATVDEKAMTITWNAIEDDIIPANEGVLLKGDASAEVTFAVSATNKANIVSNNMIPNLVAKTKSELGDYIYVLSGENIIRLSESGIVGANKAYLRLSKYITEAEASEAKTFTMIWNDSNVVTGINNVNVNTKSTNVYNLAGQRVNANVKGIVIMDGKKYINK